MQVRSVEPRLVGFGDCVLALKMMHPSKVNELRLDVGVLALAYWSVGIRLQTQSPISPLDSLCNLLS